MRSSTVHGLDNTGFYHQKKTPHPTLRVLNPLPPGRTQTLTPYANEWHLLAADKLITVQSIAEYSV